MKTTSSQRIALAAIALLITLGTGVPSLAANCQCYYSSDCPDDGDENTVTYCNWQARCTRHCELQGEWDPSWGQPPVSQADCDKWIGPCHDNEPQPPQGDDGDGENCEPPTATGGNGQPMSFKVRDGNCATRKKKVQVGGLEQALQDADEVERATEILIDLARSGGGPVDLGISPYLNDVMYNVGILALGQYDFASPAEPGDLATMADVRGTCAAEALEVLGQALVDEILYGSRIVEDASYLGSFNDPGHETDLERELAESWAALGVLSRLSPDCARWVSERPHNCQFPHPEEHHHVFEYPDGMSCIAHQLHRAALSLQNWN